MNFYDSIIEGAQELSPADRGQLYAACLEFLFYGREPDFAMRSVPHAMFVMVRPVLENQRAKQSAGSKGGKARAERQANAKQSQSTGASRCQANAKQTPSEQEQEQEYKEPSPNGEVKKADPNEWAEARRRIVAHLNATIGSHYKPGSDKTRRCIDARLREGYAVEDFLRVIDTKAAQWIGDPRMAKFLRPETLFGPKFEGYLNEPAPRGALPNAGAYELADEEVL